MPSTPVSFQCPSGLTLTQKLFALDSDVEVASHAATEQTNRKGFYVATVTEALSGIHQVLIVDGSSNVIANYFVNIRADDTNTYHCEDSIGAVTALPDAEADAAGGLPISDAGGLDLDTILDVAISTRSSHTAVDVRSEMDSNSTQLAKLGTPAGASVSADIAAVKAETADILADTNELQLDWQDAGRLDTILDNINTNTGGLGGAAMRGTDNALLAASAPANFGSMLISVGGVVDADIKAIDASTLAAQNLGASAEVIVRATVDTVTNGHVPTATQFQCDDVTNPTTNHFVGRVAIFRSGTPQVEATAITGYILVGGIGQFTVDPLVNVPANDDTLVIM